MNNLITLIKIWTRKWCGYGKLYCTPPCCKITINGQLNPHSSTKVPLRYVRYTFLQAQTITRRNLINFGAITRFWETIDAPTGPNRTNLLLPQWSHGDRWTNDDLFKQEEQQFHVICGPVPSGMCFTCIKLFKLWIIWSLWLRIEQECDVVAMEITFLGWWKFVTDSFIWSVDVLELQTLFVCRGYCCFLGTDVWVHY